MSTRVVVLDDHQLLREAVCTLVESEPGLVVVGSAGSVAEGNELMRDADLVLLDVDMPGGGAFELAHRLRTSGQTKSIVVSMHQSIDYVRSAIAAGANGYVFKTSTHKHLIDAIHHVLAGRIYLDPAVAHEVDLPSVTSSEIPTLSEREREMLIALARGEAYKDLAARAGISARTIETYRRRIAAKLGLRTRADFMRYALELGWMKDPA